MIVHATPVGVGVQLARELGDRRDQGCLSERERERGHTEDQERADGVGARAWVVVGIVGGGSSRENRSVATPVKNGRRDVGVCRTVLAAGFSQLAQATSRTKRTAETTDREEPACSIA